MTVTTTDRPARPIDPRIQARRIEVRRGAGRRRLQRLIDVGLLLLVVAAFAGALRSPLLDVDQVRVTGAHHTPSGDVLARSGIQPGDQLMDVDLRAAGEAIARSPWVDEVHLHRGLDGGIEVTITERTAVAVAGEGADAVLVDAEGRVLAPAASDAALAATLVRLTGAPGGLRAGDTVPEGSHDALLVAALLARIAPGAVAEVTVGADVIGELAQGGTVRFGDARELEAKVRSLRTVLDQVDLSCLAVIDVRLPSSTVLTREEGCP